MSIHIGTTIKNLLRPLFYSLKIAPSIKEEISTETEKKLTKKQKKRLNKKMKKEQFQNLIPEDDVKSRYQ